MTRKKKIAKQVYDRLECLSEFLNTIEEGFFSGTDQELIDGAGCHNNRKALYRDLKRLEELRYVKIDSKVFTPVSIKNGTATQYVRKNRRISFQPGPNGLLAYPKPLRELSHCGHEFYNREDVDSSTQKWIVGWDHTLTLNPDYKG